jgi:hypothetical protein
MLPYMTIPIALPGDEQQGNKDKIVPCKITPSTILAYHEGFSWGTFIYLQTGQAFCCTLSMEELEAAMRDYWKQVTNEQKKFLNGAKLHKI